MKKYLLTGIFLGLAQLASAQILTVRDQENGDPLIMATIYSETPAVFATTDDDGRADISEFREASAIEIRMLGYRTQIRSFEELEKARFAVYLEPEGLSLGQVVVSATRWNQSSGEVPAKISSIAARDVALQNPQTAADLLGIGGKVFIQKSQQGGGSPMIRGFSTNRLLYAVDGVRINTAIFRSGNLQNVISLDPFVMERTEVLFGPGSVIYGSDAIGGVMSFQTLTPQFSHAEKNLIKGKALARYSSVNEEQTVHFHVNLGWKKWSLVSSLSSFDFGDLRMGRHGPEEYLRPFYVKRQDSVDVVVTNDDPLVQRPSGYSQINMMQKLRFRPSEKWDFQYGFHYSGTSAYSRYDRHIRLRNGLPRSGEWAYGPQVWMMNNLNATYTSGGGLFDQATLRVAHQYFEESRIDRNFNDSERRSRLEEVDAWSANLDFQKRTAGEKHMFYYGLEAVANDVRSTGTDQDISTGTSVPGPARYPQATWASYAAYLNYQHKLTDKLLLQAGARYNYYLLDAVFDTTFYPFPYTTAGMRNGALTGSLGFVWRPSEAWVLSANASTGFRSPNVDDSGKVFDSEPGFVIVPNPDLKAEYAYNGEIGLAKVFGKSVKIDLSVYYTTLKDALVRRDFQLNGLDSIVYDGALSRVQAVQNAAVAEVYGVQAGLEVKLPAGFGFSTDFNYQVGEEELDDGTVSPSRHAPPMFGATRLSWSGSKLFLQLYAQYSGERWFEDLPMEEQGKPEIYAVDDNGNPWSPAWYTLNFKAMYQFAEHFSVSAGLENLTDVRYRPYSSGIVAPGRNVVVSLAAVF
jgi:hemoglobin/transferrin/lactoferrin receptor protein